MPVGLIFKKQYDAFELYYVDPENHKIPSGLEQLFKEYKLDVKQLTVETQRYANCGPEVIENFMFYLTGERLPQETAIQYHSLLVEQDLLNSAENQIKQTFLSNEISNENKVNSDNQIAINNEDICIINKDIISEDKYANIIEFNNTSYTVLEVPVLGLSPDHTLDSIFEILS